MSSLSGCCGSQRRARQRSATVAGRRQEPLVVAAVAVTPAAAAVGAVEHVVVAGAAIEQSSVTVAHIRSSLALSRLSRSFRSAPPWVGGRSAFLLTSLSTLACWLVELLFFGAALESQGLGRR